MIKEYIPKVGEIYDSISLKSFDESVVMITGYNGAIGKNSKHAVIDLVLPTKLHRRYLNATITVNNGQSNYYIAYKQLSRNDFLLSVKENYPDFFEWLLFHIEWI